MTERRYLTPGGVERLRRRLDRERAAYKAVCDSNPEAREAGDSSVWHDNFAFEENQRRMHQLARRIRDLEELASSLVVVPPRREAPERVVVGARVVFRFLDEDREREVYVAGWDDGDPAEGRLSYNSPLGRRLLGAEPGDEIDVVTGRKRRKVEILDLLPAPESEAT